MKAADSVQLSNFLLARSSATFKLAPPPGVYVNVSPNDPAFWSGVLFVQKGKSTEKSKIRGNIVMGE